MRTRVSSKGRVTLPAEIRRRDQIEAGHEFEVERLECGEYRLIRRQPRANARVVDWLLSCPEKGFFVPIGSASS
jgi:AbrB family looped-hinge helix DNA binding protein